MIEQRKTGLAETDKQQTTAAHAVLRQSGPGAALLTPTAVFAVAVAVAAAIALALPASASAQAAAAKADPAKGDKLAQEVCAACHGPDGNSTAPINPKLAGQHPSYLFKQLTDFKVPEGEKIASRNNAVMAGFAAMLSEDDMRNLAAFYSSRPLKPSAARNAETVTLGKQIFQAGLPAKGVPACAGCHGPRGEGMPSQYPVLHGQYADYTESQLVAFRPGGARKNNGPMAAIAERLTDPEIKAVADYVAGLR